MDCLDVVLVEKSENNIDKIENPKSETCKEKQVLKLVKLRGNVTLGCENFNKEEREEGDGGEEGRVGKFQHCQTEGACRNEPYSPWIKHGHREEKACQHVGGMENLRKGQIEALFPHKQNEPS